MTTEKLRELTKIDYEVWKNLSREEKTKRDKKIAGWESEWEEWLFKEEGVEKNPKRHQCFQIAWDNGHSSGYEEVENEFRKMVELIK